MSTVLLTPLVVARPREALMVLGATISGRWLIGLLEFWIISRFLPLRAEAMSLRLVTANFF